MLEKEGIFWVDEEEGELVLKSEEGEQRFCIEDELTLDDNEYLILVPTGDKENEDEEAVVLKLIKEGDEEVLTIIDDDEEFESVKNAYIDMMEGE